MRKPGSQADETPQFTLLLAEAAIEQVCRRTGIRVKRLSKPARQVVAVLSWQTNVAELESWAYELVARVPGPVIELGDVLSAMRLDAWPHKSVGPEGTLREAHQRWERDYILAALKQHRGQVPQAAKALGINRPNLYRKMRKLQISTNRFKVDGVAESARSSRDSNGAGKRPRGRPRRRNRPAEVATTATGTDGPPDPTDTGSRGSSRSMIEAGPGHSA